MSETKLVNCPQCGTFTFALGDVDHTTLSANCGTCGHGWLVNRLGKTVTVEEDKALYRAKMEAQKNG